MNTRILLVDDHRIFREGLRAMLEKQPGFEIIGEAESGWTAIKMVQEILPDVVIMDVVMPDLNGIEATRQIIGKNPAVKIIGLSMQSDIRYVTEMLKAGSSGFLLKDCAFEELVNAIKAVRENRICLSPGISEDMIKDYINFLSTDNVSAFSSLTAREREVLQFMAEGKSMKDIASRFGVSAKTIETHRQNIMEKLDIHNMAELVKFAIREGLTSL